jgi:hypothetical protein
MVERTVEQKRTKELRTTTERTTEEPRTKATEPQNVGTNRKPEPTGNEEQAKRTTERNNTQPSSSGKHQPRTKPKENGTKEINQNELIK